MKLKEYKNLDDLLASYYSTFELDEEIFKQELADGTIQFAGITENGEEITYSYEDERDGMREMGYWGFVDEEPVIHYWIDEKKNISLEELIHFFAHEIGHRTGTSLENEFEEEMRAEDYGKVATMAYEFAKKAKKTI